MASGVNWKKTPRQAWSPGAKRYVATLQKAVFNLLQSYTAIIEAKAKQDAEWTDRTGHARQTLSAGVDEMPMAVRLYLKHGVDYGKWLEVANGGKYAIIAPTLHHYEHEIFLSVRGLLK